MHLSVSPIQLNQGSYILFSLPCDPTGAGGGSDQAGSQGGDQIKFQTFLAGPEDRGKREKTTVVSCALKSCL